jgi:hypothetical protein
MPTRKPVDFLGAELDVPARSAAAPRDVKPKVTVKMAQGLVGTIQLVLANLPWTRDDTLDDLEQKVLVKDIVAFADLNPFFAKAVVWIFINMGNASLPLDTAMMAGKRLARRELVPAPVGVACEIGIIASAAAHDIKLNEEQAQIASLFGGLMGEGEDEQAPLPTLDSTPDLVSFDLKA